MWRGRVLLPWHRIRVRLSRCVVDRDVFNDSVVAVVVGAVVVNVIVKVRSFKIFDVLFTPRGFFPFGVSTPAT
jgi:hypothetical protein